MPDELDVFRKFDDHYLLGTVNWAGHWQGWPAFAVSAHGLGAVWAYREGRWQQIVRRGCWADIANMIQAGEHQLKPTAPKRQEKT